MGVKTSYFCDVCDREITIVSVKTKAGNLRYIQSGAKTGGINGRLSPQAAAAGDVAEMYVCAHCMIKGEEAMNGC